MLLPVVRLGILPNTTLIWGGVHVSTGCEWGERGDDKMGVRHFFRFLRLQIAALIQELSSRTA